MKISIAKPFLTEEDARAAYEVILSGWVTQGPKVQEFEKAFAEYTGAKYAVAVSSCTTALHLSLIVSGIGPGDEVICPSMSFIATANAIKHAGATPVFAEVNHNYNLDAEHVKQVITPKTKAILLVHQIGMPADIDTFTDLCKESNLLLIEDAACAAGSAYKGKKIGSHSGLVCFSFHPRKVITTGDGGMITTSDEKYYERLKRLRQHGMSVSDTVRHNADKVIIEDYLEPGYNYRMTDIQAAIGIKQLEKLDDMVAERKKIASYYADRLSKTDQLILPVEEDGYSTNWQSYSICLNDNTSIDRNALMQQLLDKGISTRRGIMNVHRTTAYKEMYSGSDLPVSEKLEDQSILLPIYCGLKEKELEYITDNLIRILKRH